MHSDAQTVELVGDEVVENLARAALFAALVGACAYVSSPNPWSPVPVTLQVLAVFLAGILLGPTWGAASMVLYLVAGAAGVPVFAGGEAGLGPLQGPSGGYLWSYPLAAGVIGAIVHGGARLGDPTAAGTLRLVVAMVAGTAVIYALGVTQLWVVLPYDLTRAVVAGAVVFLPFEAVKVAAAVGVVRSDVVAAA